MLKKGAAVTIIFGINTLFSLISQIVITRIYGARLDLDIFLAAVSIPTILVTVIYGTLNDAFLPHYGEIKNKNPEKAESYFFSHLLILSILSFLLTWIVGFFTVPISDLLYHSRGEAFVKETANQMFYMLFSAPLSVIATILGSYFYAKKQFIRFPIAQAVGSIVNIALIVFLANQIGIWALVFAFVANIFIQILFVFPLEIVRFSFAPINILPLLLAWLPLLVGSFALRSDTILIRSFGAHLAEGYLVYLNLISKIFSLATGVMTIGIQVILLPHLIEYIQKKEYDRMNQTVNKSKIVASAISIFVVIMLMLISPLAINLLFVGGKFTQKDADIAISLLPMFVVPAIGWGINSVFFQPLLALKKQWQLGILYIISFLAGWLTAYIVNSVFGALPAITAGLIVLLFTGIIGSEILWQYYRKKLMNAETQ